jgi:hypothetical protein
MDDATNAAVAEAIIRSKHMGISLQADLMGASVGQGAGMKKSSF